MSRCPSCDANCEIVGREAGGQGRRFCLRCGTFIEPPAPLAPPDCPGQIWDDCSTRLKLVADIDELRARHDSYRDKFYKLFEALQEIQTLVGDRKRFAEIRRTVDRAITRTCWDGHA